MLETISILIVDDVPENLRLLSAMLEQVGYLVRPATSAKAALRAARQKNPSLILLDMRMPEMSGLEMCRLLKAAVPLKDIPVIFISALNETEEKIKALQAGGVDYITKPFQEREVLARVATHLELRRQKIELEAANRRLKELESLRDNLTHMIAHDMKTPLMVINGHLNIIEMFDARALSKDGKQSLAEAGTATKRLTRMVSEMLLVSKLEVNQLALAASLCDLAGLARKAATDFWPANNPKKIKTRLIFNPEKITLALDAELIERVFQNLLGNAAKYSPEDGTVALKITTADGRARVEVSDAGPGIAPEFHQIIFEKFGQVDTGMSRQGTGLGLAFCKLAVEAHGGSIGVNSQPGRGSTFWFTLQLQQELPPARPAGQPQ